MKVFVAFFAMVAVTSAGILAPTLIRTPNLDSAVIKSDRLGGNFAYSSVEGHAYTAINPVVQNVVSPVGVSLTAQPFVYPTNVLTTGAIYAPGVPAFIPGEAAIVPPVAPVAPVAPGIIAPALPGFFPTDYIPGLLPAEPAKEGEKPEQPAEAPVAPVEPQPLPEAEGPVEISQPADAPLSDDSVAIDSA